MQIIEKSIKDLKPYGRNPRKNDDAVEYVLNSIRQFGFRQPIIIDKNNVVVCGHTRLKAAKQLGLDSVPCIMADDLTDEQIKAFRLADNKVSEKAEWDFDLLDEEIADLAELFDFSDFGFDFVDEDDDGYFGDARERTYEAVNLNNYDPHRVTGPYDMPIIHKETHIPTALLGFNYMLNTDEFENGVHFFIDDYQFERVWNEPNRYLERLSLFDCVLTPDFSLYMDMPIAMQIWNVYRSRLIGQMMQDAGIRVIPTLSWSSEKSYDFCFDGIEPGGVCAVSTVGVMRNKDATDAWIRGMDQAFEVVRPSHIILYGSDKLEYDFRCEHTYIESRKFNK